MATIIQRGDAYCVKYRDPAKKQRWESFATKKLAERRKAEIEHQKNVGKYVDPRDLKRTVGEAWAAFKLNRWPRLRHTTQTLYELTWRVHLAERWEHTALRSIGAETVEAWQAEKLASGDGKRTVQAAVQLLGAVFKVAERYRWVDYSPVTIASKVRSKSHVVALMPAQIARLIVEADADTALLIQVAAATGLRIGELFGLRWLDVDLDAARLSVRQQYGHGRFAELKTKKARRNVPLPAALLNPLREWKLRQPKGPLGLVFPSSSGGPADAHNFYSRTWKPLLKRAELPADTRFHQLRHSFATALIAGSENAKTVSTLMGHATAAFTMDVYADYWPENFEGIAARVSDRLFADVDAVRAQVGSKLVADEACAEDQGAQVIDLMVGRVATELSSQVIDLMADNVLMANRCPR